MTESDAGGSELDGPGAAVALGTAEVEDGGAAAAVDAAGVADAGGGKFTGGTTGAALELVGTPLLNALDANAPAAGGNMWELLRAPSKDGGGTPQRVVRIYVHGDWRVIVAINCTFDNTTKLWTRVANGNYAFKLELGLKSFQAGGFLISAQPQTSPNTWYDDLAYGAPTWAITDGLRLEAENGKLDLQLKPTSGGSTYYSMALDGGGLRGDAPTEFSAIGYIQPAAPDSPVGIWGNYRHQFSATPGTFTFVAANSFNVINGNIAAGWVLMTADKNGALFFGMRAFGGTAAYGLVRYTAS